MIVRAERPSSIVRPQPDSAKEIKEKLARRSAAAARRNDRGSWIKNKDIDVFIQFALKKHPDLPNVPLIGDLVSWPETRAF